VNASLNEEVRRAELAKEKTTKNNRTAARDKVKKTDQKIFEITLDNADKPDLELAKNDKPQAGKDAPPAIGQEEEENAGENADWKSVDPIRDESLRILSDLIELSRAPHTANAN